MILSQFGVEALREPEIHALLQRATELCAEGMQAQLVLRAKPAGEARSAPTTARPITSGPQPTPAQTRSVFGVEALREPEIHALLQRATELCAEGMQAQFCKALEYKPGRDTLLVCAGVGWGPDVIGRAAQLGRALEQRMDLRLAQSLDPELRQDHLLTQAQA
jgi:hypothetical protein